MAVQDIMIALRGYYEPTGVYSFEFRRQNGKKIAEIFFLLPPESVMVSEPQRSVLLPTLGGGYYVDFGNEFKEIKISGSSHFYYSGAHKSPAKEYGDSRNLGAEGYLDGFTEFIKLRFMVSRYRDYTMTKDGKLIAPSFGAKELSKVNSLKKFVKSAIEDGEGALADNVEVIWHDYDYDDHFKVRVDNLSMARDKSDPWTVKYDISLQAYGVDDRKAGRIKFKSGTKKPTAPQLIREAYLTSGDLSPETRPDSITIESPGSTVQVENHATSEIENPPSAVDIGIDT